MFNYNPLQNISNGMYLFCNFFIVLFLFFGMKNAEFKAEQWQTKFFEKPIIHDTVHVYNMFIPEERDVNLLARLLNSESKGEPLLGQVAVGEVVKHRMQDKNKDLRSVIYAHGQFDGINTVHFYRKPGREQILASYLALGGIDLFPSTVLGYHNKAISTDTRWVKACEPHEVAKLGNHTFIDWRGFDWYAPSKYLN